MRQTIKNLAAPALNWAAPGSAPARPDTGCQPPATADTQPKSARSAVMDWVVRCCPIQSQPKKRQAPRVTRTPGPTGRAAKTKLEAALGGGPFTTSSVARQYGLETKRVQKALRSMFLEGRLKVICERPLTYVRNNDE